MSPRYRVFVRSGGGVVTPPGGALTRAQREAIPFDSVKSQATTLAGMRDFMTRYTGVLPETPRTPTSNDTVITTTAAGQVIENLEVLGRILVRHDNVIIRNCWIRHMSVRNNASDLAFIDINTPTRNCLIEDCQIGPVRDGLGYRQEGFRTMGYTAKRCRVVGTGGDAFTVFSNDGADQPVNVAILGSWVENMNKVCPDGGDGGPTTPFHGDGTHNDSIQYQGGVGMEVRGCLLQGRLHPTLGNTGGRGIQDNTSPECLERTDFGLHDRGNGVIQWNTAGSRTVGNCFVENNWLDGGVCTNNGSLGTGSAGRTLGTFTGNVFTKRSVATGAQAAGVTAGQYLPTSGTGSLGPIYFNSNTTVTISGNVYEDGSAVEVDRF